MKPAHKHDCEICILLGQLTAPMLGDPTKSVTWDFYFCPSGVPRVVARAGDNLFTSAIVPRVSLAKLAADQTKWPLNVAAQLVIEGRPWS